MGSIFSLVRNCNAWGNNNDVIKVDRASALNAAAGCLLERTLE